jgi:type VI secretion system secreted protein Hcp
MRGFLSGRVFLVSIVLAFLATQRSFAAFEVFLKLDAIPGESIDAKHPNEIIAQGISCGVANTGAAKASFQDLTIIKGLDKSSPILMLKCASGESIASAVISLRRPGTAPFEFYKVTLQNVIVSSISQKATVGVDEKPVETVTLRFSAIHWTYTPQKPDGSAGTPVEAGWDLAQNAAN